MKFNNLITLFTILAAGAFAADETESETATKSSSKSTTTKASNSKSSSTNSCSLSKTTITNATALGQIVSCPTLDGQITISGDEFASVDLPQLRKLEGDLTVINSKSVVSINMNQLQNIEGKLCITNMTQLITIDLSSLRNAQDLEMVSLPSFANLVLNQELQSTEKFILSDTALSNLNGLTSFSNINYMNINNNKNITQIQFPYLRSVSDALILSFNNDDALVDLNQLQWASNLTIQSVGTFSANVLHSVNGTLQISYNIFDSLNLSNLSYVGSSLQIFAHDELTSIDLENLQKIGGELSIFNNSELQDLSDTFPSLETVEGAVAISGDIANLSMNSLQGVKGDFQLNSTSDEFDCSKFNKLHDDGDIEGHRYICSAAKKPVSSSSGTATRTGGSSATGSSSSSSGGDSDSTTKSNGSDKMVISSLVIPIGLILAVALL